MSSKSGGGISYLRNAVRRLLLSGATDREVSIVALCDQAQANAVDVPAHFTLSANTEGFGGLKRSLWEKKHIPRIVRENQIDIVFTPYQVSNFKTPAKQILMLRNMEPFFFQRYGYSWKTKLRNYLLRYSTIRSVRRADHTIAVSKFASDQLIEDVGVPESRVTCIYHGRDPFFSDVGSGGARLLDELNVNRPFVLTCGSILPYRRCEDVIEAFIAMRQDIKTDFQLVVAGDGNDMGYKKKLQELVMSSGFEKDILFLGHVSRERIRALYQAAKVVVFATEIEACPNIVIEAMTTGALILAGDTRPLPEIIGADNAEYFVQRDVDSLAHQLKRLISTSDETRFLKEKSKLRSNDFCWDRCVAETLKVFKEV